MASELTRACAGRNKTSTRDTYLVNNEIIQIKASPRAKQWAVLWLKREYSRFYSFKSVIETAISSLPLTMYS